MHRYVKPSFNGAMITKTLLPTVLAGIIIMVCGATFAQTTQMTGTVLAVSSTTITVQKDSEVWDIKRTKNTSVNGTLKVGSTVTVTYSSIDAQKKEGPGIATSPTPTPAEQ